MTVRSLGVVIPAYRPDVPQLQEYVHSIDEALNPASVLVELDSPDRETIAALRPAPARIEAVPRRRGKGAAITAGFEQLETDILLFADADGATPVESLVDIVDPVRQETVGLAVGSRRHPAADISDEQPVARQILGEGFSQLAGALLSVTLNDYQCGAKAIDARAWDRIRDHLYEPGFAWDVELIAIAGAFDVSLREVPIEWEDQPGSTVSPVQDSARMLRALLTSHHRAKQLADDQLHTAIAARTPQSAPLVERRQER